MPGKAVVLLSIGLLACSPHPYPIADDVLINKYRVHQRNLEKLASLVLSDAECIVIREDKSVGCDAATVKTVLSLLPVVGAYAIYREGTDVRFAYDGSAFGQKGLSFCGERPLRLVQSTDIGGPGGPSELEQYSYVPIQESWYIYFLFDL